MITKEKESQDHDSPNLAAQASTSFIPRNSLIERLSRSKEARARFVDSNLNRSVAFQIKALRAREKWTQEQLAKRLGMRYQNNVSARLENSRYGRHSLSTLKKIAAAFDVALVVWFIPYSRFIDWATETPYIDKGLTEDFYDIPEFSKDEGLEDHDDTPAQQIASSAKPEETEQAKGLFLIYNRAGSGLSTEKDNDVDSLRKPVKNVPGMANPELKMQEGRV